MIYKTSFLQKEGKQAYLDRQMSRKKQIAIAVFTGMLTFSLHFLLQSLRRSVLADAIPQLMQTSYFSVLTLYLAVVQVFYVLYFMVYYEYLTFAEIEKNKWYVLVKHGFSAPRMILTKLFMRASNLTLVYTGGFFVTVFLTMFLKYPLVSSYWASLYLVGLMNLLFLMIVTMVCSLFIQTQKNARYALFGMAVLMVFLQIVTGFQALLSNRPLMSDGLCIFTGGHGIYPLLVLVLLCLSLGISVYRAKETAKYSNFRFYEGDMDFPKELQIICSDGETFQCTKCKAYLQGIRNPFADVLLNICLAAVVVLFILCNACFLLISLATPEREVDVFGYIPYVFCSETMEPSIMYNDLAVFHTLDEDAHCVEVGEIILYKDEVGAVSVARVLAEHHDGYEVDIENYTPNSETGQLADRVVPTQIYGVYAMRSRWLGALILFGNTTVGRILMLLIPTVFIFYYKTLAKQFSQVSTKGLYH